MSETIRTEIHGMCKQILKNQITILQAIETDSCNHKAKDDREKETKKILKKVGNRYGN